MKIMTDLTISRPHEQGSVYAKKGQIFKNLLYSVDKKLLGNCIVMMSMNPSTYFVKFMVPLSGGLGPKAGPI